MITAMWILWLLLSHAAVAAWAWYLAETRTTRRIHDIQLRRYREANRV